MKDPLALVNKAVENGAVLFNYTETPLDAPKCPSTDCLLVRHKNGDYEWIGVGLGEPEGESGSKSA